MPAAAPWCSLCLAPRAHPDPLAIVIAAPAAAAAALTPSAPTAAEVGGLPQIGAAPTVGIPPAPRTGTRPGGLYPEITPDRLGRHARSDGEAVEGGAAGWGGRVGENGGAGGVAVATALGGPEQSASWPCLTCGCAVPLAADLCPSCGAAFLGGPAAVPTIRVPVIGLDLTGRGKSFIYAVAALGGLLVSGALVGLIALLGSIF